jgi:hypothetical protein
MPPERPEFPELLSLPSDCELPEFELLPERDPDELDDEFGLSLFFFRSFAIRPPARFGRADN